MYYKNMAEIYNGMFPRTLEEQQADNTPVYPPINPLVRGEIMFTKQELNQIMLVRDMLEAKYKAALIKLTTFTNDSSVCWDEESYTEVAATALDQLLKYVHDEQDENYFPLMCDVCNLNNAIRTNSKTFEYKGVEEEIND